MICKGCHNRVPERDVYCVNCGRQLNYAWVGWLALVLLIGALLAISPVVYRVITGPGSIAHRIEMNTLYGHGYVWIILAYVQAAAALTLAFWPHRLLQGLVVAGLGLVVLYSFNYYGLGAGIIAALVLVLVVVVARRLQWK